LTKDDGIPPELLDLIGKAGENGARLIAGIYSTPWTGIPFTLILLSQLDPSGKYTALFLANLAQFFGFIGNTLGNALSQFGTGAQKTVNKTLSDQGANPTNQPPPPPPLPAQTQHTWAAHTTGYISGLLGAGNVFFTTAAERDKWVNDTNGSFLVHLTGNRVDETWDQDVPNGARQNDIKIPAPRPWWIIPI
jgi:hypothetical protein